MPNNNEVTAPKTQPKRINLNTLATLRGQRAKSLQELLALIELKPTELGVLNPADKASQVYVPRSVPVYTYPTVDGKAVKGPLDMSLISQKVMVVNELIDGLDDYRSEFTDVFIGASLASALGQDPTRFAAAFKFIIEAMQTTDYTHYVTVRGSRMWFCKKPLEETQIGQDFIKYCRKEKNGKVDDGSNRLEHLGQLLGARGIACNDVELDITGWKVINSDSSDGHTFLLTKETGALLGLPIGWFQNRSAVGIYSKGTIIVSDLFSENYINMASIKVNKPMPATLNGRDIIIIQSSIARPFDNMRMGHQDFYQMETYGRFPQLIVQELLKKDGSGKNMIQRSLPTETAALLALGMPIEYISQPDGLVDSLLLQARPEVAKMFAFAMVNKKYMPDLEEGWYAPAGLTAGYFSALIDRSPRMANGGSFQEVQWVRDEEGNHIWSPLGSVILLVVDGEPGDFKTEKSRINHQKVVDMGADVDGDRLAISSPEGAKLRYEAGLQIITNVPQIKAKDNYPGVDWTPEGRLRLAIVSIPRKAAVGMGDTPTQDARDMYIAKKMDKQTWDAMAWAGANKVQEGVSAPKYFFKSNIPFPINPKLLDEMMKMESIGKGRNREGALWEPAIKVINDELAKLFPAEPKKVTVGHPGTSKGTWDNGGFGPFLDMLKLHDPEIGENWILHVRRCFARVMRAQAGINNILLRENSPVVRRWIASFIKAHPDQAAIWTWLLKPEYVGVEEKGQVLKIMGMPFSQASMKLNAKKDPELSAAAKIEGENK